MKYDTIIIGGGLSGLTCAVTLAKSRQGVALVTDGQSCLHFGSGSIDLLGYADDETVGNPFESIQHLPSSHPYRKLRPEQVDAYADEIKEIFSDARLKMKGGTRRNHYRITPIGVAKPAWLTMDELLTVNDVEELKGKSVLLVNIEGFLDFPVQYIADGLKDMGAVVSTASVSSPELEFARKSPTEMRATNIAKYLDSNSSVRNLANELNRLGEQADLMLLPAVFGFEKDDTVALLRQLVKTPLSLIGTIQPSLPGVRIQTRLRQLFQSLGGSFITSNRVNGGDFDGNRLTAVTTDHLEGTRLEADHYVLATGSFLSGGLKSNYEEVYEPVFHLDIDSEADREKWTADYLFDEQPYMAFGLRTTGRFNAVKDGKAVENLYAAGSVLSGNNGIKLADSTGVSMITGLAVAHNILNQ